MKTSIQIAKIMDIPINLHITFILILPVFAFYFSVNSPAFGFNDVQSLLLRYALSMSAAILLFTCVLLHELGHSYVAKKHGANIQSITLFLFGGVSSMEEIPRNPKVEFKMALAGPAVSLMLGAILIIIYELLKTSAQSFMNDPSMRLIWLIGYINIVLFAFNLLPAFPMDGGRVLRSWLAGRMSYIKATKSAAGIGKMFAIFMGIFGLLAGSIWFILIAFFIYIGASEEEKSTEVAILLEGVKVKDIMSREVKTVNSEMTVEELVDTMFRFKHMGYPVLDDNDVKGMVTFTDVQKVPKEERKNVKISQIMTKGLISLNDDADAVDALKLMTVNNIGRIVIMDDKKMAGIISRTDILRSVELLE